MNQLALVIARGVCVLTLIIASNVSLLAVQTRRFKDSLFGPTFHVVGAFAGWFVAGCSPAENGGPGVFRLSLLGK